MARHEVLLRIARCPGKLGHLSFLWGIDKRVNQDWPARRYETAKLRKEVGGGKRSARSYGSANFGANQGPQG